MSARPTLARSVATSLTAVGAAAVILPLVLVAALGWPRAHDVTATATAANSAPPVLDTAPVRAAALALVAAASTKRETAATTAPADAPSFDAEAARMQALGTLTERIYAARDVRRKDGKAGAELRKPFSFDELGGERLTGDLALAADRRLLVQRDGTVLAPAGAALPAGIAFGADTKTHASATTSSDGGSAVAAVRYCPYAEVTCLVDIERIATPSARGDAPAQPAAVDASTLDAALATLAGSARLATATPTATVSRTSLLPFSAAWLLAAFAAVLGIAWLYRRADAVARAIVGAGARLQQAAAGRAPDAASPSEERELAALHAAITTAAQGIGDAATRATREEQRRARSEEIAKALAQAAAARDLSARVRVADVDDPALLALVDGANRLLESLDHSVLRWQSHAKATGPRAENARALEGRAEALKPLAALLSETSERVLRLSDVEGAPARVQAELRALGVALGQRGKTARTLVDALLLDLATERPQARHDDALVLLRDELAAFKTSDTAPERVAALKDLPPAEIGERVADERA